MSLLYEMEDMMLDTFEVTKYTMAVVAEKMQDGRVVSKVIELEGDYHVNAKPLKIIERSCRYFGSSLKGRQDGTREVAGITHKAPIAIDPTSGIYMFPTLSPNKDECTWLAHTYISKVEAIDQDKISVTFHNNKAITIPVSKGSFENQLHRTAQFRYLLSTRINKGVTSS